MIQYTRFCLLDAAHVTPIRQIYLKFGFILA